MVNLKVVLFVFFLISTECWSQNEFSKDTSFTVSSAWKKVSKNFELASPVLPLISNEFLSLPNQVYRVRSNRLLRMDVFIPNTDTMVKHPVVMMIHGGGWRSGNKSHLVPLAQSLAVNGYVTATVEHRLSAEALYPAAIYDLKEAVKFLKQNSELYGIDTSKMVVLGCSSGATLASFVATTSAIDRFEDPESVFKEYTSNVQALINMDGVLDFTDPNESAKDIDPNKPSAAALFFGATFNEKPELWKEASPINYVDKKTPPTLFINSALPRFHAGRDSFISVLKKHHIYSQVHTIKDTPHPYWLFHPWFEEAELYILNFLHIVFN